MKSSIIDRLSIIAGHGPKASLEDAFWDDLRQIAKGCDETLSQSTTNTDRQDGDNVVSQSSLCSWSSAAIASPLARASSPPSSHFSEGPRRRAFAETPGAPTPQFGGFS